MTPVLLTRLIIEPVVKYLDWPQPRERIVLLTSIAIQESALKYRKQVPNGPALSFWQIEPPTCVDCLQRNERVRQLWHQIGPLPFAVDLEHNDAAACAIAAGILRLTPGQLPEVGDWEGALRFYLRAWRPRGWQTPGASLTRRWPNAYSEAVRVPRA